jgi:hypothetical protein
MSERHSPVRNRASRWEDGYVRLAAYRTRVGHVDVPARYLEPDGYRLGQWAWSQRIEERHGRLDPDRRRRLDELGFSWSGRRAHLERLVSAVLAAAAAGLAVGSLLDADLVVEDVPVAVSLRRAYRRHKLNRVQVSTLEAVGFCWNASDAHFERGLTELRRFRSGAPDAPVRSRYITPSGFRLGEWLRRQHQELAEGRLAPARRAALVELGDQAALTARAAGA